ncbi:MAG TPA: hypothetical protein VGR78_11165 [Verrucomicrobiae bacterium]|nr:hypothetical protein [Verrucomicrobiae bacterium]
MPDANSIAGSIDVVDTTSYAATALKKHLEWSFHKNTNGIPSAP